VDGEEKSEGGRKFDAISWIWDFLLPDRVARSQLNQSHVGVILTGDLNQRLDNSDQSRRSLRVRTEAMGIYANLAERFQHLDSEYSTWGRGRLDLKGVHMIDHVFTLLPDQVFRAGGSPSRAEWEAVSDHLPVCGSFHFGQLQGCVEGRRKKYIAKPAPSLRLENAADRAAAAADMASEWGKMTKGLRIHPPAGCRSVEADGQMLEYLSRQTADIMRRMAPPVRKPRGRRKSSQSSLLQCSRLHFRMLVQLNRVCTGKVGRKVLTTPRDMKRAFNGITKAWAQKDAAIWAKAEIVKPAGLGWGTGRAREWWAF
jgi:hypothetical protein